MVEKLRQFWSIGDLSREFDVTARTLRFYEDKGLLSPQRDGLVRRFTARDRARMKIIMRGKRIGLSLEVLKQMIDLYDMEDGKRHQLLFALRKYREQLIVLENQKNDLEAAIDDINFNIVRIEDIIKNDKE